MDDSIGKSCPCKGFLFALCISNHLAAFAYYQTTFLHIIHITMRDTEKTEESGAYVQAYTMHIMEPIYPDDSLSQQENVAHMLRENEKRWKEVYEKTYGEPLTYLTKEEE